MMCARIHLRSLEHFSADLLRSFERLIEIVGLEPQQHAVAVGVQIRIPDVWMFVRVPVMKLQDHSAVVDYALILRATVTALATQHGLIPATACLNIANGDEGLGLH